MKRTLKLLRRVQTTLEHLNLPTVRACGLSEGEFEVLRTEGLVECFLVDETAEPRDRFRIERVSQAGHDILARSPHPMSEWTKLLVPAGLGVLGTLAVMWVKRVVGW